MISKELGLSGKKLHFHFLKSTKSVFFYSHIYASFGSDPGLNIISRVRRSVFLKCLGVSVHANQGLRFKWVRSSVFEDEPLDLSNLDLSSIWVQSNTNLHFEKSAPSRGIMIKSCFVQLYSLKSF